MDIVCNIDNGYVKYCVVMLTSLFINNKNKDLHIHIIADDLSEESQFILSDVVEKQYKQHLSFYLVGAGLLSKCPIDANNYISISTYYRCFLTTILPSDISKVLYLDCDLIVRKPLDALFAICLDGYAVGAVEDMWSVKESHYIRLRYPEEYSYFNAGVLLVNLDYWRQHDIEDEITEYITNYPERLLYNDQDVLNTVLYARRLFIPFRWNMQYGFFRKRRKLRPSSIPALEAEMPETAIVHFTGGKKPWHEKSIHPYKKEYFKYLDLTRWSGERPPVNYLFRFSKLFNPIQGILGWKNIYRKI